MIYMNQKSFKCYGTRKCTVTEINKGAHENFTRTKSIWLHKRVLHTVETRALLLKQVRAVLVWIRRKDDLVQACGLSYYFFYYCTRWRLGKQTIITRQQKAKKFVVKSSAWWTGAKPAFVSNFWNYWILVVILV
jgi:hypothetical protein